MKKVFTIMLGVFMGVSLFAAKATPAQIQEWQKKLDNAKNNWEKVYNQSLIDILGGEDPKSYQEVYNKVLTVVKNCKYNDELFAKFVSFQIICWNYPELVVETYKEVMKGETEWRYYYTYRYSKELNLSVDEIFDNYYFVLTKFHNDSGMIKECVKRFLIVAADVDEVKVKKALKVLNRKYSSKLLEDKATWEPVVAMIRTTLETY